MIRDSFCDRQTDCAHCSKASEGILTHRILPRGKHFPADKCVQNHLLFMTKGEMLINSPEYPGTTLYDGQFVLQAIGSKVELLALTEVEYILFSFNETPLLCDQRYAEIIAPGDAPVTYTPLVMTRRLFNFMNDLTSYLDEAPVSCGKFIEIKSQELIFLVTGYYPLPQLRTFFYPISRYTASFQYFVMQNYIKVKNVEEFAHLGGYSVSTFRRLFRNVFNVPVYEWILEKKREGIIEELQHSKRSITEISNHYGFDSLSHFAHFCKDSFGDSPRALRKKTSEKEKPEKPDH